MLTHGPPKYRLDTNEEGDSIGCAHLFRAVRRMRPRVCGFGHCHAAYGVEVVKWKKRGELGSGDDDEDGIEEIERVEGRDVVEVREERGKETVFTNGALMGREGLERMPWVLEMELERAGVGDGKVIL